MLVDFLVGQADFSCHLPDRQACMTEIYNPLVLTETKSCPVLVHFLVGQADFRGHLHDRQAWFIFSAFYHLGWAPCDAYAWHHGIMFLCFWCHFLGQCSLPWLGISVTGKIKFHFKCKFCFPSKIEAKYWVSWLMKTALEFVILCSNLWLKVEVTVRQNIFPWCPCVCTVYVHLCI